MRDGGALLMAAGPEFETPEGLFYTPLGDIAPARPTGDDFEGPFRAEVSPDGAKHPVTRGLTGGDTTPPAWGQWFRRIGGEVTSGVSVMQGSDKSPLLVLSRVEKGRVALLLSDQLWLWARGYDGGGPYLDLLRRLAHWLMKEPELEEEALRERVRGHELTVERQSLKNETPQVTVTGPDGQTHVLQLAPAEPGLSRATLGVDQDGLYRASDGEHVALVNVGPDNPLEFQEVVSTTEKLRPLAEATGGTVRRLSQAAGRYRLDAAGARHAGIAGLRRRGLHRDQADRRQRARRRLASLARGGFSRAGGAAGSAGLDVGARRREGAEGGRSRKT